MKSGWHSIARGAGLLLSLLCFSEAGAQTLIGSLVDAESRAPVANATVVAITEDGRVVATVLTDSTGTFQMRLDAARTVLIQAQRIGYQATGFGAVAVAEGEVVELMLPIPAAAVVLDEVVATTELERWWESQRPAVVWPFYERMDRFGEFGAGRFLTSEDIEAWRRSPAWAMLSSPLGFGLRAEIPLRGSATRAITMRAPFGGRCRPLYFFDGLPMRAAEWAIHATIEEMVEKGGVEGIEIFNADYVPSDYASHITRTPACVIAVWTRQPVASPPRP